ncbi:MAG TPA: 1,6-anhydro-N-acetylmuramyl-L-alanine amidase AmpD [Burkholderiaceae bacterium]|jgi:AmpD protein|nr:1,6-anhydro-N-acetylmuramyl-L-alanine amidase AmpD [Burkholderiaceae bacterium]
MSLISTENALVPDAEGWCREVACEPSPNFDERPQHVVTSLLVVHNISLPAGRYGTSHVVDLFCNRLDYQADPSFEELRGIQVSAHFLIRRDGRLIQFVSTNARAWHAGISSFDGKQRCNDFSIGIELEGCDDDAFADAQYDTLSRLTAALQRRYPLTDVAGHQHIAPGRKTDPGPFFDWPRYHALLGQCQAQNQLSDQPQALTPGSLRFAALR